MSDKRIVQLAVEQQWPIAKGMIFKAQHRCVSPAIVPEDYMHGHYIRVETVDTGREH
ncbi:MAG TPA: hypothetical protein VGS11_09030 [Candidatus Bathyarchaeia archaeon]|nr:hypothetical protein [Candidatus Bathyarchaeia archaeon]